MRLVNLCRCKFMLVPFGFVFATVMLSAAVAETESDIEKQISSIRESRMDEIIQQLRRAREIDSRGQLLKRLRAKSQGKLLVLERRRSLLVDAKPIMEAIQDEKIRNDFRQAAAERDETQKARRVQDVLDKLGTNQRILREALLLEQTEKDIEDLEGSVVRINDAIAVHIAGSGQTDVGGNSRPEVPDRSVGLSVLAVINEVERELSKFDSPEESKAATVPKSQNADFSFLDQFNDDPPAK